jgi:hypothetical protein
MADDADRRTAPPPSPEVLDAAGAVDLGADPLERVVDDYAPREEALNYAVAELAAERSFEDVAAALVGAGWPAGDADEIVEAARQQTRAVRGAMTREDAVREAHRHYRQGNRGWAVGCFPTAASVMRLLHALGSMASYRRRGPRP